jgi:hypothetical protein
VGRLFITISPQKKSSPHWFDGELFRFQNSLNDGYVSSGRAFLTLFYIESNPVTLFEGFKSGGIDPRVMDEHIRSVFLFDKTKSFLITEPFHNPSSHRDNLLSKKCGGSKHQVFASLAIEIPPLESETDTTSKINFWYFKPFSN